MSDFDHKALISNLSSEDRNLLLEQTDRHGLRHFALHAGGTVLCGFLIAIGIPFWPSIMLIQGILICFLFTTLHETVHRTPFKTDALNIWIGRICGFLVFLEPEWFRFFHLAHHRFTHDPEKDPELASPKPDTTWQYLKYLSGIPDWTERVKTLFRNAMHVNQDNYVPRRGRVKVMKGARIYLTLYTAIAIVSLLLWSPILIYVWLLPILIGGPFLRAYLLAEHARCPNVSSMLENTRTTLTNRIVRFLAWNMPFHAEHHAYPSVPFHKLPEFHHHTRAHLLHQEAGYLQFNRTYLRDSFSGELSKVKIAK